MDDERQVTTLAIGGRDRSVRQVLGLAVTAVAAVVLAVGQMPGSSGLAWGAVVAAGLLFAFEPARPVRRVLDRVGGVVTAALVSVLLLGTGGADSVLQDVFVIILVYAVVVFGWRRLAIDVVAVVVAAAVPGVATGAGRAFYVDLAADLAVWVAVAVMAGTLEHRAQTALGRSRRLRSVVDDIDDIVTVIDTGTDEVTYVNRRGADRLGLDASEVEGRRPWELTEGIDEERYRQLVARLELDGPSDHRDRTSIRSGASEVYAISTRLVTGDTGAPQLVSVARDVTEQRHRDARARERSAMVQAADVAMVGTDVRGFVVSWNPAAERLYGLCADTAQGQHIADLVGGPVDDPLHGRDEFAHDDGVLRWSTRHVDGDGAPFRAELTALPFAAEHGGGRGVAVLVRDISDHRAAVQDARRRETRFRTLAEEVRGVVYRFELGPPLRLTFMSDRMTELLGDDPADLLGGPGVTSDRVHPDDRPRFAPGHPANPRETDGVSLYRVRHLDGHWVWVEDHHRPELDAEGRAVAVLGVAFDVTARQQEQRARQQAFDHERRLARELERTVIAQQSFLRSVSHELRTPLTAVRGFASTLRRHWHDLDDDRIDEVLARLEVNTDRLDGQLADLLDLDVALDRLAPEESEVLDLHELAAHAVRAVRDDDHELTLEVPRLLVRGDRRRLRRAVDALVHNAVRHTPAGTSVRVWAEERCDEVLLHVADDGPGVDPAIVSNIFDAFVQGREAAAEPSPGAGIGLALVRRVAALHGGRVEYVPGSPHGSCFCLHLPRDAS